MDKIELPLLKRYKESLLVDANEVDLELEDFAKKLGFESHEEKIIYLNSHKSGWYMKNKNKSIWDTKVLAKYFKDKTKYLEEVNNIPSVLSWIEPNYK